MSPETQGQEQAFRPSIPDLTPNLDQNPTLDAKVEDSKEIYDMQVKGAEDARTRRDDLQRILDERAAGDGTDSRPQWELEGKLATEEDAVAHREKGRQEALNKAEQRYRENEEAIRNQAVIDAARAGIEVSQTSANQTIAGQEVPPLTPNLDQNRPLIREIEHVKGVDDSRAEQTQQFEGQIERFSAEREAVEQAIPALKLLYQSVHEDEKAAISSTLRTLEYRKKRVDEALENLYRNKDRFEHWRAEDVAQDATLFRDNEETVKNQAVNEARARGIDINYPGYTDQELQSQ